MVCLVFDFSALIRSVVSWVAVSAEEITGIMVFLGNSSTLYEIRSDLAFGNVDFITPVVLNCWSYVPNLYPMLTPCAPYVEFFMNYDLGDWWCQRCFVEVKISLQHCVH